jgi:hypothetical protein
MGQKNEKYQRGKPFWGIPKKNNFKKSKAQVIQEKKHNNVLKFSS